MHDHNDDNEKACTVCEREFAVESSLRKDKRIILIIVSAILFSVGLVSELVLKLGLIAQSLFLLTAVFSGFNIAREGISSLIFRRRLTINFLILIAAIGSFFIGHVEEGAAVIFLFYIADFLEDHAGERARRSIMSLMKLAPEIVNMKRDSEEIEVHAHDVGINEIIVVRPGEKIPLDGDVVKGASSVNQAPITGESVPVAKQMGDKVYAGTINNEGFLEIRVTKLSEETVLSKIVRLVEEAQKIKSPTEKFIDEFSKYYTPFVIFLAVGVATVPTIVFGLSLDEWIYKALVLLVISCPCALAISTPVAMVSGITNAAKNGVLIKGSAYVEEINKITVFAFDKTGTLTEGKLEVTDIVGLSHSQKEVLFKAACSEALSEHPIAKAIIDEAKKEKVELRTADDFKVITGKGVTCKIDDEASHVGNRRLFKDLSVDFPEEQIRKLENEGKTVLLVGNEKEVIGLIAVMDRIRDKTAKTMAKLKDKRIETVMITGDNEITAKAIADKIGITEYRAKLLPEDKVRIVESLSERYGRVAMVGDGVNDAPALAKANVGIAMGAIGSDVSLETADIALMEDDLSKLPYLIRLSKKTMEKVRQNVATSILIKGSFAILVFPGFITLWLAVAIGDMGLSLAVILNALRLSLVKST